jgi:Domain of unknown function (DUF4402)
MQQNHQAGTYSGEGRLMKRLTQAGLMMLAMTLGVATTAAAQNSGSITATATVQQPINVLGAVNLDFQNVFPGVIKSVALTDGTAGRFDVTGQASAPVTLAFTSLPTNLDNGGISLPISYTAGYNTTNNAGGATTFAPASGTGATLSGAGALFVFVGGTVTPAVNQAAGAYTGTITLQVSY